MTSKQERIGSQRPDVAANGLMNRRALLGRSVLLAGAAATGVGSSLTSASAEPLPVDPWSKVPGEKIPAYGVPAKYENKVERALTNPNGEPRSAVPPPRREASRSPIRAAWCSLPRWR